MNTWKSIYLKVLIAVACIITMLLSLLGNGLVITVILRYKRLKNVTNYILLSLFSLCLYWSCCRPWLKMCWTHGYFLSCFVNFIMPSMLHAVRLVFYVSDFQGFYNFWSWENFNIRKSKINKKLHNIFNESNGTLRTLTEPAPILTL